MTTQPQQHTFQYGDLTITLETGQIARQASAAVMLTAGDTQLLATVVGKQEDGATRDFLPLTVNYQERAYAAGNIPGGYFKREGRPAEHETLISRLIDRPLRPLFPNGFYHEVQVIITVLSAEPDAPTDVLGIIASSAALAISGIPFQGPLAAARVGYRDGEYLLNPRGENAENSDLDLVVAAKEGAVLMVESEANQLSEEVMLGAVMHGYDQMQVVLDAIHALTKLAGKPAWDWQPAETNQSLKDQVVALAQSGIEAAYQLTDKTARYAQLDAVKSAMLEKLTADDDTLDTHAVDTIFGGLKKDHVRGRILAGEARIDGRDLVTVRPISAQPSLLKRTHGSSLFTRGETQVLSVVTLAGERSAQMIETLAGEGRQRFMLHYNFQPYCVGEVGFLSSPKRREIGHGKLAWRALNAVMPQQEQFPYVTRVVAETTESNGSSSMATVCASSMALMDAGVPLKAPVAGIAMGLIKEDDRFAVLTDILGDEDHLGDMDFKVAGTEQGITALQMDIKIAGITKDIMEQALAQAKTARLHILGIMNQALDAPRQQLSAHAPRIISFQINPDKIRDVIGKGGATIRALTEETGTSIDITDEGLVTVCAQDQQSGEATQERIKLLVADIEEGAIYEGKVIKIVEFGAFVNLLPGKDGLLHVSQIAKERVNDVNDYLKEGETITVKVLEVDRAGKVRLSRKVLLDDHGGEAK